MDAYGMDEFPKHRWKQHRGRGTQIAHRLRREARAGSPPEGGMPPCDATQQENGTSVPLGEPVVEEDARNHSGGEGKSVESGEQNLPGGVANVALGKNPGAMTQQENGTSVPLGEPVVEEDARNHSGTGGKAAGSGEQSLLGAGLRRWGITSSKPNLPGGVADGVKKMQEGYKMNELSGNHLAHNEDVNAKKVMGSQGNHPSTGSPVFETTPTRAQQGNNEEQVEHVKPRALEFEDPAEVGITEQLDDEFKAFVRRLTRAVRITRINWGDAGKTPAEEGIHGKAVHWGEGVGRS